MNTQPSGLHGAEEAGEEVVLRQPRRRAGSSEDGGGLLTSLRPRMAACVILRALQEAPSSAPDHVRPDGAELASPQEDVLCQWEGPPSSTRHQLHLLCPRSCNRTEVLTTWTARLGDSVFQPGRGTESASEKHADAPLPWSARSLARGVTHPLPGTGRRFTVHMSSPLETVRTGRAEDCTPQVREWSEHRGEKRQEGIRRREKEEAWEGNFELLTSEK